MPKKINNFSDFLSSKRFKNLNVSLSCQESILIEKLYDHIKNKYEYIYHSGTFNIFKSLILSKDYNNLINRFDLLKKSGPKSTLETFKARYGEIIGNQKWENYIYKQKITNTFEYKYKKYGWSKEDFDQYNKNRAVTFENCIKKHGANKGKEIWENYIDRQSYTNSLQYYEEKYGKNTGYKEWKNYNEEKGKSSKIDWIMEKYQIDFDEALVLLSNRLPKSYSSAAELTFINDLENLLCEQFKYTAKTRQFCLWNYYCNSPNFYDITCTKRMKIIEFHGDYWHCNPLKFSPNYIHKPTGKTAKQIWENDYYKIKTALNRKFEVKIIWWSDYVKNPEKILEECTIWLKQ